MRKLLEITLFIIMASVLGAMFGTIIKKAKKLGLSER